jgi:hypothetical protein
MRMELDGSLTPSQKKGPDCLHTFNLFNFRLRKTVGRNYLVLILA